MKHPVWPPSYIEFFKGSSKCFKNSDKVIKHGVSNSEKLTVLNSSRKRAVNPCQIAGEKH